MNIFIREIKSNFRSLIVWGVIVVLRPMLVTIVVVARGQVQSPAKRGGYFDSGMPEFSYDLRSINNILSDNGYPIGKR